MSDPKQSQDPGVRQRKLDELFSDEPFLSPTMKAHRLYQKIDQMQAQQAAAPPAVSRDARLPDVPAWPPETRTVGAVSPQAAPAMPIVAAASPAPKLLSLFEAAAYIRKDSAESRRGVPDPERLLRFRQQVLLAWVRNVPRREARK